MNEKIKTKIDELSQKSSGFIKVTDTPTFEITSEQKVLLNRKGNVLFNEGNFDSAKKLFLATGYSDGLTRVADVQAKRNKELEALKLYWLAHNKRKSEPLIEKLAAIVSLMLKEEKQNNE
ncbi:MAG: hypothetical protein ACTTHG_00490 [Treponemataceae bacterium]